MIILKQAGILFAPPSQINESLIWLAAALIGVPGLTQILALRFGNPTSTAGSPPAPPGSGSSPSPSGASTPGAEL